MTLRALNADFPGPPPEPGEAAERILRLKTRRRDGVHAAIVLCVGLATAVVWEPAFIAAAAAGLVTALAVGGLAHVLLADLLDEFAMYPCMSGQPEVAERQRRLIQPDRLASLARQLRGLINEGPSPAEWMDVDALVVNARVRAVAPLLLAVADTLERCETADPVAVARLRRLLRVGITSPLYDRTLTAHQLDVILRQALWRMAVDGRPVTPSPRLSTSTVDAACRTTDTP
jgi:hypothetical protein